MPFFPHWFPLKRRRAGTHMGSTSMTMVTTQLFPLSCFCSKLYLKIIKGAAITDPGSCCASHPAPATAGFSPTVLLVPSSCHGRMALQSLSHPQGQAWRLQEPFIHTVQFGGIPTCRCFSTSSFYFFLLVFWILFHP